MRVRPRVLLLASAAAVAASAGLTPAGAAGTHTPAFKTVRLDGSRGRSEPRVVVAPNGMHYTVTNASYQSGQGRGSETVYKSRDGVHWKRTTAQPDDQTEATTDVDIVATSAGRIITSELDDGGINFRTMYSDDGGASWHESLGNTYADTDRQWYAVGPKDPTTHQPRVYLLFHDLLSGVVQHNMFVATSTDGGATFGPPVPVAIPGQQDYADLQCADSGGPSNIFTDPRTGRVFVVFGTRSSTTPAVSGCTASPPEVNVVAANRVWVVSAAAADTATPGGWTPYLAVNDTGPPAHIVGMQLAPGAIDAAGNVYVAYPESLHDYPDYDGAAIKVVHARESNLGHWSRPSVVAAGGGAGNILPHIVAGDRGRVDIAWYHGVAKNSGAPVWYSYAAQSLDALSTHPHWARIRLSGIPAEIGSASKLMGACLQGQQATLNGFYCDRATDVNGIAADACGRLTVAWPAQAGLATDATYVSQQVSGARIRLRRCR